MQTKLESFVESLLNILVGFGISFISQLLIFPLVNIEASLHQNIKVALWFTAISLTRSYALRRYFNKRRGHGKL